MGSLSNPTVLQAGSSIGQFAQAAPAATNYVRGASAISVAAVWPTAGAATSNASNSWDNGFAVTEVAAVNGIADYISRTDGGNSWLQGATAYSFAMEVSAAKVAAVSPQSRIELRLTGGVAQTFYVDFNSATGQLLASSGVIGNLAMVPFVVPKIGTSLNVTVYRLSFTFVTNVANIHLEIRCYPRSDGGAGFAGGCLFGGPLVEDYVTSPSAFISTPTVQSQSRPAGTIPHQLIAPTTLIRRLPNSYTIDRYADQGATLVCDQVTAYVIDFGIDTVGMPAGTEITILREVQGGTIQITNSVPLSFFYNGNTGATVITLGSSSYPGVQSITLRKTSDVNSNWSVVNYSGHASAIEGWSNVVGGLGFAAFAAAALQSTLNLYQLPARGVLHSLLLKTSTAFSGGAVATCTLSIGVAGNLAKYLGPFDVKQAVGDTIFMLSSGPFAEDATNAKQIVITMDTTGANTNALTQGACDIYALQSAWV